MCYCSHFPDENIETHGSQSVTLDHMMHQGSLTLNTTSIGFHATSLIKFYHSTNTVTLWNITCHYISDFFIISVVNCFRANTSLYHSTSCLIWPQLTPFYPCQVGLPAMHTCLLCLSPTLILCQTSTPSWNPSFLLHSYPNCPHDCNVHLKFTMSLTCPG